MKNNNIFKELCDCDFELIWMQEEVYIFENKNIAVKIAFDSPIEVQGTIQFECIEHFKTWLYNKIFYFKTRKEYDLILKKIIEKNTLP